MEFIFQLFAEMFSRSEAETEEIEKVQSTAANNVAEYESEVEESPLSEMNFFEMINFH